MLDKIKFWKRDDDFALGNDDPAASEFSSPRTNQQGFDPSEPLASPLPQTQAFGESPFSQAQQSAQQPSAFQQQGTTRELDLVVAKLDALKLTLENINQRLTNLERIAQQSDESYDEYRKRSW